MASYQSNPVVNKAPARLVDVGVTPVYVEVTPTTLATGDTYDMFYVPNNVRVLGGFLKAVGGTGLDTNGSPALTLKVDLIDDAGTTNILSTTSAVRATATEASTTNRGYLVVSAKNNALVRITAVAGAATLGTSKLAFHLSWQSYSDV